MSRVQISLDDTKGCFKYLAANSDTDSIFETRSLGYLKRIHEELGTEFTLLCMCSSGDFSLHQVSEKYRKEFMENQDWLHFGFHAFDETSDYTNALPEKAAQEYRIFVEEITRITGVTEIDGLIRLHGFSGNREICRSLKKLGVKGLLTADDERNSYYLSPDMVKRVNCDGHYWEETEGIHFYRSLTRLENSEEPVAEIERALERGYELLAVFTHEWQMDREDIREKLQECCKWISRNM